MFKSLEGQSASVVTIGGNNFEGGIIEKVDDVAIKYHTQYEDFYIPISSIAAVQVQTVERPRAKPGFVG